MTDPCDKCHGRGWVLAAAGPYSDATKDCPECSGTGEVVHPMTNSTPEAVREALARIGRAAVDAGCFRAESDGVKSAWKDRDDDLAALVTLTAALDSKRYVIVPREWLVKRATSDSPYAGAYDWLLHEFGGAE